MSQIDTRSRRVSGRQLDLLWEYLNSHRDIALAHNRSLRAKEYSAKKWQEVAELLNSQGEGAHKDWKNWSKYWVDFKAKLKKRAIAVRSAQSRTGGGPSTEQPLTEIELKFLQILGNDFGQGLPGIRVEPFPETLGSTRSPLGSTQSPTVDVDSPSILNPENEVLIPVQPSNLEVQPLAGTPPRTSTPPIPTPPIPTPTPVLPAAVPTSQQRLHRHRDRMDREAARRALVQSSQMRAEATVRSSNALETIARGITGMEQRLSEVQATLQNIESK